LPCGLTLELRHDAVVNVESRFHTERHTIDDGYMAQPLCHRRSLALATMPGRRLPKMKGRLLRQYRQHRARLRSRADGSCRARHLMARATVGFAPDRDRYRRRC
jgi:hypothetical protein